jgi:hypothetical protein
MGRKGWGAQASREIVSTGKFCFLAFFFLSAQWETAPMCRIRWISFFLFLRTLNREARGSREDIKRRTGTTESVDMEDMNI